MDRAGLTALNYGGDHYCPGASRQGNGIFPPPEIDGCQDRTFFGHRKRPSRFLSGDSLVFARASLRLRESPGTKQTVPSFLCFYYWCLRPVMTIGPLSIDFASARFYPKASGPPCAPRCAQPEETPWAFGPGRQEPAARVAFRPLPWHGTMGYVAPHSSQPAGKAPKMGYSAFPIRSTCGWTAASFSSPQIGDFHPVASAALRAVCAPHSTQRSLMPASVPGASLRT